MAGQVIFQSDRISITPTIAKFDGVSYQVANIGSVRVDVNGLWHPIAVLLLLCCLGAWIVSYNSNAPEGGGGAFFVGFALLVAGGSWQRWLPRKEYVLLLRTSSGDVQAYRTKNRAHIAEVKNAFDAAFNARH